MVFIKIARVMSTQHPDNVRQPFFADNSIIAGDDEIKEAFYSFSHLNIKEQLWDCEGKEVDNFVVEKLMTKYEDFFREKKLGEDFYITLRGPNPRVEKNKGKLLLETLESIPRNADIAKEFYGKDLAPIFEITLPMTSNADEIIRLKEYYKRFIIDRSEHTLNGVKIKEWIGEFHPKDIKVIPLIEDKDSMLNADKIVSGYLDRCKEVDYQRVWLARSDPALNYGNLPAILANRLAFQRLHVLQEDYSVELLPIIGCGSVPFRGNFRPDNYEEITKAYPSVQTYTAQSAYKYDFPESQIQDSVEQLESTKRRKPNFIEESQSLDIIEKVSSRYQQQISLLAPMINKIASHIPKRRKRKMHIGLFGYSRDNSGVKLPRAITFCASLYSFGIPPEILGMDALDEEDWDFIIQNTGIETDILDSLKYFNKNNLRILPEEVKKGYEKVVKRFDYVIDEKHEKLTRMILENFEKNNPSITESIEHAAILRKFLG